MDNCSDSAVTVDDFARSSSCFTGSNRSATTYLIRDEQLAIIEIAVQLTLFALALGGNVLVLTLVCLSSVRMSRHRQRNAAGRPPAIGAASGDGAQPLQHRFNAGFGIGDGRIRSPRLSRMNRMVVYLSGADLFVAFFNVLPQLLWDITVSFRGNDALCRSVTYFQLVAMFASSYVLVAAAVDRYLAICHPLSDLASRGATGRLVIGAWIIALIFALPQLVVFGYRDSAFTGIGRDECWAIFEPAWSLRVYITWTTLAIYVIPSIGLISMYSKICVTVWKSVRRHQMAVAASTMSHASSATTSTKASSTFRSSASHGYQVGSNGAPLDNANDSVKSGRTSTLTSTFASSLLSRHRQSQFHVDRTTTPDNVNVGTATGNENREEGTCPARIHAISMTKAKIRTMKLTVSVNISYVVCWGPFFISHVWAAYDPNAPYEGKAMTITVLLASLNSCINPWIYVFFISNVSLTTRFYPTTCGCGCKWVRCRSSSNRHRRRGSSGRQRDHARAPQHPTVPASELARDHGHVAAEALAMVSIHRADCTPQNGE